MATFQDSNNPNATTDGLATTNNTIDVNLQNLFSSLRIDSQFDDLQFQYYSIDDVNNLYSTHPPTQLSLFHVNIRSLHKNGSNLLNFINSCKCAFDVYILSEVWNSNIDFYKSLIPGYDFLYSLPEHTHVGGVGVYIRSNLNVSIRMDLQVKSNYFEILCLEFTSDSCKYLVCAIYRHPNSPIRDFIEALSQILSNIPHQRKTFLVGDINIDLKKYNTDNLVKAYVDELESFNFAPLVFLPTRITDSSATIIDHIFSNCYPSSKLAAGIITVDIADHLANFLFIHDNGRQSKAIDDRPSIRIFSNKNICNFYGKLSSLTWDSVYSDVDVNNAYDKFYTILFEVFEQSFPLIKASRSWASSKSWVTPALRTSIKLKSKLHKKWVSTRNPIDEKIYKTYANQLKRLIEEAKNKFYNNQFQTKCKNIKLFWKTMNDTFSKKQTNSKCQINELLYKDKLLSDKNDIVEAFAEYFSQAGSELAKNFSNDFSSFRQYLPPTLSNSCYLYEVNQHEVLNLLNNLPNKKSTGIDGISPFVVKLAKYYITGPLTHIFNLSISSGVFPNKLKIAKLVPLYKKNDKRDCANYRPIAITSIFSKLLEKIMYSRLLNFFNKSDILYDFQFGFRKNYSTSLALLEVINTINSEIHNKCHVMGIFLDLKKAFDTVNHTILLNKLENYGLRGSALNWIKSFLTGRKVFCKLDEHVSSEYPLDCGVPQGAVLSPLLFLLFVNDMHRAIPNHKLRLFADDSNVFIISHNLQLLFQEANLTLKSVHKWLGDNKLSINLAKTNYILFKSSEKTLEFLNINNLKLELDNQIIARTASSRYLGVIINERLSWAEYIQEIIKHIRSYVGIFYKYKSNLSMVSGKLLYNCCILPKLNYGIELYGISNKTTLKPLEIQCNKILRCLQNVHPRTHCRIIYNNFNTLPVNYLFRFSLLKILHKSIYDPKSLPNVITSKFATNSQTHNYCTRNQNDFHYFNNIKYDDDPLALATRFWNWLPDTIKLVSSKRVFHRSLKSYYLNNLD